MRVNEVTFSIAGHAAWAPGIETPEAWNAWADAPFEIGTGPEPGVKQMPAMLRRRAGFLGKMALEVAYRVADEAAYGCADGKSGVPAVFCSRHGDVARALELLSDLGTGTPLSPASFGLAVHNAGAGLFSIARGDKANHLAVAGGASSIEHAVIEACGLLADGAPQVLLVAYDTVLPQPFAPYQDCREQPHAWAWLLQQDGAETIGLSWEGAGRRE
ncbi:MAG TPA: beta-ketoacyl synthase chain length factor, partial [Burkholderiaceae bacterium]